MYQLYMRLTYWSQSLNIHQNIENVHYIVTHFQWCIMVIVPCVVIVKLVNSVCKEIVVRAQLIFNDQSACLSALVKIYSQVFGKVSSLTSAFNCNFQLFFSSFHFVICNFASVFGINCYSIIVSEI
jgi:hypothetical protein